MNLDAAVDIEQLRLKYEQCLDGNDNCDPTISKLMSEIKQDIQEIEQTQNTIFKTEQEIQTFEEQRRSGNLNNLQRNQTSCTRNPESNHEDEQEKSLQDKIDTYNAEAKEAEEFTNKLRSQMEEIVRENETYQAIIAKGVGWTIEQEQEREEILQSIVIEKESLDTVKNELGSTRQQMHDYESRIDNIEKRRKDVAINIHKVREKIEAKHQKKLEKKNELNGVQNQFETLTLRYQEQQEKIKETSDLLNSTAQDEKKMKKEIKEVQSDLEQLRREIYKQNNEILKYSKDLEMQHHKNMAAEEENTTKQSFIRQKMKEAKFIAQESSNIVEKKRMVSGMISEIEIERLRYDQIEKELQLKLKKIEEVELKTLFRELESQKQQLERLERERATIERKKNHTDKSAALAKDIMASNESTLIHLQNEALGLRNIVVQSQKKIKELHHWIEAQNKGIEVATNKRQVAADILNKLGDEIQIAQKQIVTTESICQQNQELCEAAKDEINVQSMNLTANQEQLELKRRELSVIVRDITRLRVEISQTESAIITEHYNHHHVIQEQRLLTPTLEDLKKQETDTQATIENNKQHISKLEQMFDEQQKEYEKQKKENTLLLHHKDALNSRLSQKNDEIEKIRETIKSQEIMLHQGQLEFSKTIKSMEEQINKLKQLIPLKHKYSELFQVKNRLVSETQELETDIQRQQIKKRALKEDLHRPFNIHRWRMLEHLDPQKFEKIKEIQRLQKQVISSTERVSDKGTLIRDHERECMELKQFVDNFPLLEEIQEQLKFHKASLLEKQRQMKDLELDVEIYRRRMDDLKRDTKGLKKEKRYLEEHWMQEVDKNALSSNLKHANEECAIVPL